MPLAKRDPQFLAIYKKQADTPDTDMVRYSGVACAHGASYSHRRVRAK